MASSLTCRCTQQYVVLCWCVGVGVSVGGFNRWWMCIYECYNDNSGSSVGKAVRGGVVVVVVAVCRVSPASSTLLSLLSSLEIHPPLLKMLLE